FCVQKGVFAVCRYHFWHDGRTAGDSDSSNLVPHGNTGYSPARVFSHISDRVFHPADGRDNTYQQTVQHTGSKTSAEAFGQQSLTSPARGPVRILVIKK